MIEDLKQVRDALGAIRNCYRTHSTISSGVWECKIKPSLAALDRIIADHIPDASKMVVPDGYKLVPIEPTRDMIDAFMGGESGSYIVDSYKAMLSAAPQPPTKGGI